MRRRDAIASLSASLSLALPAFPASAQSTGLQKIRIAGIASDALTPLFYAVQNGSFQRAGIAVEFISMGSGSAATAAVLGGTYELSNPSLVSVMSAHLHGVPLKNPFGLLQVPLDSPLRVAADLNNKTIAVQSLNNFTDLVVRLWVDKHGGDSRTLKFVEIPFSATESTIAQHRVDAGLMLEPLLSTSLAAKTTKTFADVMGSVAPTYMLAAFVARADWASQNTELLRTFDRILADATIYCNAHPAETAAMMAEATKTPLAVVQGMRRVLSATTLDPKLLQPLIDASAKYQLIAQTFPAKELFWSGAT
jgi:NitT/TauT family transport system substrate-binding protein